MGKKKKKKKKHLNFLAWASLRLLMGHFKGLGRPKAKRLFAGQSVLEAMT
jgi:hypothetical protein